MSVDERHDDALNAIEDIEMLSLRWGDVDGSLDRDEILDVVARKVGSEYADEIVEALIDTALIRAFDVPGGGERYRTRFAEAIRLLVRARQIFRGESWRGAPPLVADFKVDLRPRRYPKRDRNSEDVLDSLDQMTEAQREVWRAITPSMLSSFQEIATARLLSQLKQDDGTIITAGTGSGKTWAFYLPVLLRITKLSKPGEFWTKAIAIYPRKELLKDQLTEAYRNFLQANAILNRPHCRPLRVGAYFGDTPKTINAKFPKSWQKMHGTSSGFVCPLLRCVCDGDLIWLTNDIKEGRERLVCASDCGHKFDEQTLPLTRKSIRQHPPDVLFTTTEMLNRSLSDQYSRKLFGIRMPKARQVQFLLLDEAHTYNGVSGAQAALTLRRWRALTEGPVRWVGLSATLEHADEYFSSLTGLSSTRVAEITPAHSDMVHEGREYQIALRGDPGSRTALLSTSIQAIMLLARVLDISNPGSYGRFGRKLFAFTDNLDVTQRLYDDLRDAEGYDIFRNFQSSRGTLAALRESDRYDGNRRERDDAGQLWRLPEEIGHDLSSPLLVARTTSRDPGVNREANVVVATSALEVGFNDPEVGAILQHKAPRNFASFLQRRGRAGRERRMRPLTVTVLSDYGRDRLLFQSFEQLFDPMLATQFLPIRNQYVLRMQAAFALLDWIGDRSLPDGTTKNHVWRVASAPPNSRFNDEKFRSHLVKQLAALVNGTPEVLVDFTNHLRSALNIDENTVNRILWEPPRSILLEVVPTLLRRIYRDWKLAHPSDSEQIYERYDFDHPLPESAPKTLYSDLNLPEVTIVLPPATSSDKETTENLPIQQALLQLVPGRVSRRFGEAYGGLAHWVPVPSDTNNYTLSINNFAVVHEFVGQFEGDGENGHISLPVYRPWSVQLEKANLRTVGATSNAFLDWVCGFVGNGIPISIQPPPRTAWREFVRNLQLYLHQFHSGVSVRRFAPSAQAHIKRPRLDEQIVDVNFINESGNSAALGYEFETDGLALTLEFNLQKKFSSATFQPELERAIRSLLFKQLSADNSELPIEMNVFQREWIRQIFLLTTARRALVTGQNLAECAEVIASETDTEHLEEIIDALLGVQDINQASDNENFNIEEVGDSTEGASNRNRLEQLKSSLLSRLTDHSVRTCMSNSLQAALSKGNERNKFLLRTLESTMADALIAAVTASAPLHMATDSLVADLVRSPEKPDEVTIWVTETTVGGAGILQALSEQYAREPRSLFFALEAVLEPSDIETASEALHQTYELMSSENAIAQSVESVRNEASHEIRNKRRCELLELLKSRGVEITRPFVVSLNARVLTPGARRSHDIAVRSLIELWEMVENEVGIELDPREIAVLGSFDDTVTTKGTDAGLFEAKSRPDERARVLSGLLWPKTDVLRREALANWTPFRKLTTPLPQLVRGIMLDPDTVTVSVEQHNWKKVTIRTLSLEGAVRLEAPATKHRMLKKATLELLTSPVNVGHLQLYSVMERISRESIENGERKLIAQFVLREQV